MGLLTMGRPYFPTRSGRKDVEARRQREGKRWWTVSDISVSYNQKDRNRSVPLLLLSFCYSLTTSTVYPIHPFILKSPQCPLDSSILITRIIPAYLVR